MPWYGKIFKLAQQNIFEKFLASFLNTVKLRPLICIIKEHAFIYLFIHLQWTLMLQSITVGALAVNKQNCVCVVEEHCSRSYFSVFMSTRLLRSSTYSNQSNINTYYGCTVVIQDKPKTRFGKWIHGVLTYYIHFEHKKLCTAALTYATKFPKWFVSNTTVI